MFIDEEQWERAYQAAMEQVEILYSCGKIEIPHGKVNGTLREIAVQIATAALRAAAQDAEGDIVEVPGVQVAQISNGTGKFAVTLYPPDQSRSMNDEDTLKFSGPVDL